MLQSQTTIHVIMIPNYEVMISFWGEKMRGNLNYVTVTHNSVQKLKIKILNFVNTFLLCAGLRPPNNPEWIWKNYRQNVSCKMFIKKYSTLQYYMLIRSTD